MDFFSEDESLYRFGEPVALTDKEIDNLINLAKPRKKDKFYDLGSGHGQVITYLFEKTEIGYACGLESDFLRFLISIERARTKFYKKDWDNIDFFFVDFEKFDLSDATIIYHGVDEITDKPKDDNSQINMFNTYFNEKTIKIIKRDLPLVGYKAIKAIRKNKSWFFLHKTPLENYKMDNQQLWIDHVFNKKRKTISDLAHYYVNQYRKRGIKLTKKDEIQFKKDFKQISKKRFKKIN